MHIQTRSLRTPAWRDIGSSLILVYIVPELGIDMIAVALRVAKVGIQRTSVLNLEAYMETPTSEPKGDQHEKQMKAALEALRVLQ